MNKKYIFAIAVFVGLAGLAVFWPKSTCDASSKNCESSSQSQTNQSKADIVQRELSKGTALLVDVREPDEFAAGHAENSKNVPLDDIEAVKLGQADKNKKIYVYCKSGRRAGIAKTALEKQGYTNIESLGGLSDWQSMGGDVVR